MFKTVRAQHSAGNLMAELEYTILPQSDDRSPSASSGEDEPLCVHHQPQHQQQCHHHPYQYHQHQQKQQHHRRSSVDGGGAGTRRTVIIIIVVLVLGCGVVAAAVLVPILLAARLVSSVPTSARLQTFAVAASGVIHSARGDYVQLLPVKHALPGTVIEFEPVHERLSPPPLPSTNQRKRRSAVVKVKRQRRTVIDFRHRFSARSAAVAGFRPLDFRIRH